MTRHHKYIIEPDCPDCQPDSKGRFICEQSKGETNGTTFATLCAGISQYDCEFKLNR